MINSNLLDQPFTFLFCKSTPLPHFRTSLKCTTFIKNLDTVWILDAKILFLMPFVVSGISNIAQQGSSTFFASLGFGSIFWLLCHESNQDWVETQHYSIWFQAQSSNVGRTVWRRSVSKGLYMITKIRNFFKFLTKNVGRNFSFFNLILIKYSMAYLNWYCISS